MKNINDIEIYRITHIDNIPHILKNGITHKDSLKKTLIIKTLEIYL